MTTVLVIDDDQIIVDLLKMVVEDAGHEVVIASAMDRIPQPLAPDLILTDLIPLKSYRRDLAQEWIRDLRSRYPRIPIVVVTAHAEAARDAGQLGAHHADPGVRPHPELAGRIRASRHSVVPRAEATADDHGELGDGRARDRGDHLRAVLGDTAGLVLLTDHEARDVLQEHERDLALVAELDEVRRLQRGLAEEDAVVRDDAHTESLDARESADDRRPVERFELMEA